MRTLACVCVTYPHRLARYTVSFLSNNPDGNGLCVCACLCVCMCVFVCVSVCAHVCVYECVCVCACKCVRVHTVSFLNERPDSHGFNTSVMRVGCVCVCVCVYVCVCVCQHKVATKGARAAPCRDLAYQ